MEDEKLIFVDIETTGLHPWYGDKVTCICARDSDCNEFSKVMGEEIDIIKSFLSWCFPRKPFKFVYYNGKEFDIPFILTRLVLLDQKIDHGMVVKYQTQLADEGDIDLYKELKELTGKRLGLATVSKILGCETKSGDGKNAIKLWQDGKLDELKEYCMQDVLVTEQVYKKWKELQVGQ